MSRFPPEDVATLIMEEAERISNAAELNQRECLEALVLVLAAFFIGSTRNTLAESKAILAIVLNSALDRIHAEKIRQLNEL